MKTTKDRKRVKEKNKNKEKGQYMENTDKYS